jgi:hypothetical protein
LEVELLGDKFSASEFASFPGGWLFFILMLNYFAKSKVDMDWFLILGGRLLFAISGVGTLYCVN